MQNNVTGCKLSLQDVMECQVVTANMNAETAGLLMNKSSCLAAILGAA
jgi:hypothetical protein